MAQPWIQPRALHLPFSLPPSSEPPRGSPVRWTWGSMVRTNPSARTPGALCRNRLIERCGTAFRILRTALPPTGKSSAMAATGKRPQPSAPGGRRGVVAAGSRPRSRPPSNPSVGCALASVGSSSLSESQYRRAWSRRHLLRRLRVGADVGAALPCPGGLRAVEGPGQRELDDPEAGHPPARSSRCTSTSDLPVESQAAVLAAGRATNGERAMTACSRCCLL